MSTYNLLPLFFFFNDTATTEIYTLSLHDALPICHCHHRAERVEARADDARPRSAPVGPLHRERGGDCLDRVRDRSEEHTSELQSRLHLVCRLLLEKKKRKNRSRKIRALRRCHNRT